LIAKPYIHERLKYLAAAFFLSLSLYSYPQSDPVNYQQAASFLELRGLSKAKKDYYRNLMMQDIALPQQMPMSRVVFSLEYDFQYRKIQVNENKWELCAVPEYVRCLPVEYFGFDISAAVLPEYANLTFEISNRFGHGEDSLVISNIPLYKNPGSYVSKPFFSASHEPEIELIHVGFVFGNNSYDHFRDEVSAIDNYFAAVTLLDSLQHWTDDLFPTGDNSVWGYYFQQLEISRILDYVDHSSFIRIINGNGYDPAGFEQLREKAGRKEIRARTILDRMLDEGIDGIEKRPPSFWIDAYYNWIANYPVIMYGTDYRFGDFYSGLSFLNFSNGRLNDQQKLIREILKRTEDPRFFENRSFLFAEALANSFSWHADSAKIKGETVRALDLLRNAGRIRSQIPGLENDPGISTATGQLYLDLADSYLGLARMAAGKGNVYMAEGYLEDARTILEREGLGNTSESLRETEQQLFDLFLQHAVQMLDQEKYRLTLDYISFLTEKCSSGKFDCTGEIRTISRQAAHGLYLKLLNHALSYLENGEEELSRTTLKEAMDIRYQSTGFIPRDSREHYLSSRLNQYEYEEYIIEGKRYLRYGNDDIALYYLNNAKAMETAPLVRPDPELQNYLKQAARPVIISMIGLGKARAMGYYFEEAWEVLADCREMTAKFDLGSDTVLKTRIAQLDAALREHQCVKMAGDFDELMSESHRLMDLGQYQLALRKVNMAIELALDDTVCNINDQEAWYARASLEYPAEFEKRKNAALAMIPEDPGGFVKAYQSLERYHKDMRLEESGVVLDNMHEIIMSRNEPGFLKEMMAYYFFRKEKEHLTEVMLKLWEAHSIAPARIQQEQYAEWLAVLDMATGCTEPLKCLNRYVPVNSSYKTFRYNYKLTWLKQSGWKFRYLSLFLKNKDD
jgi:hypothetical protein